MILETNNIIKNFGGLKALHSASISVAKDSITGLIGPNGAGKTTLFNAISGFTTIDSGSIRFDGNEVGKLEPSNIVKLGLTRTFQTPSGFSSMSVWENIMASGSDYYLESPFKALSPNIFLRRKEKIVSKKVSEMLERFDLMDFIDKPFGEISIVEMRFVEIIRQLMTSPKILLMDEPASGFGPDNLDRLRDMILWIKDEGITILLIEHNLPFILNIVEYVYVLANGEVIGEGIPSEIIKDKVVIENYIGKQNVSS